MLFLGAIEVDKPQARSPPVGPGQSSVEYHRNIARARRIETRYKTS